MHKFRTALVFLFRKKKTAIVPEFTLKFNDEKVVEHAEATFKCKLNEDLDVDWFHKGKPVKKNDKKYKIVNSGTERTLVINDCLKEDTDSVKAVCRNISCEANLTVEGLLKKKFVLDTYIRSNHAKATTTTIIIVITL